MEKSYKMQQMMFQKVFQPIVPFLFVGCFDGSLKTSSHKFSHFDFLGMFVRFLDMTNSLITECQIVTHLIFSRKTKIEL